MQNIKKYTPRIVFTLLLSGMLFVANPVIADSPPPPPAHGQTGNEVPGGGASIGGGLLILTALALGYAAKKYYDYKIKPSMQE